MGGASAMQWLRSSAPVAMLPKNPRYLSDRLIQARAIALANPPSEISSRDLPSAVRYHIKTHLGKHFAHVRRPWLDPRISQNGAYLQNVTAPERLFDAQENEVVEIPNPFLASKYAVENFHPIPQQFTKMRTKMVINRQQQKVLTAKYPPHVLPPSHLNPIERPPRIRWEGKQFKGTMIKWVGEWEPKERKGIYHNRGRMFKGHRKYQEKREKDDEVAERVAGMDARIDKWRSEKKKARGSARPQLPW